MMINILKSLARGKSLIRTLMNLELKNYKIYGQVLDIGGGLNPSYLDFLRKDGAVQIKNLDSKHMAIDLEKDALPAGDASADVVLMFNILEHIYNHNFLAGESFRVIKKSGLVLGFVPFLVNYHPDPRDYFRYTGEALRKIFSQAGFKEITVKEVGGGPLQVNFNNLVFALPRLIRPVIFPIYYLADFILIKLKPEVIKRYPLGYMFTAKK